MEREGANKEWKEQRKDGRNKGRREGRGKGYEMDKKLGIGRREGERWTGKGLREEQSEGDKRLRCM